MISSLREALQFSPDNIPLRYHLAEMLVNFGRMDEAEKEYKELVRLKPEKRSKAGLAKVLYAQGEYAICSIIIEDLLPDIQNDAELLILYSKTLVHEGNFSDATRIYRQALLLTPSTHDDFLDSKLKIAHTHHDNEDKGEDVENLFMEKSDVNFSHVGGMKEVKKEIELKIIKPLEFQDLYKAYGKKIGGGILLYGPPGCGKTFIARATAGEINAHFISISLNDILDMWIGNSEKNLHRYFEMARANTPCVFFIDEIDALGASRSDMRQSAGRQLINQFLVELDGVEYKNEGILFLGATNAPWQMDSAFRRPGRFDRILFIPPPDEEAREEILKLKLKDKPTKEIEFRQIARKTNLFSGADLDALIDTAIECKLETAFRTGIQEPITTKDLLVAASSRRPSTQEWFQTAKNYALFANEAGAYDDILKYIKNM